MDVVVLLLVIAAETAFSWRRYCRRSGKTERERERLCLYGGSALLLLAGAAFCLTKGLAGETSPWLAAAKALTLLAGAAVLAVRTGQALKQQGEDDQTLS